VVVICPKCKIKLKIEDSKLTTGGSRFKCPKCATVLLVKKPQQPPQKPVDNLKVLVAHSNPETSSEIISLLHSKGYQTVIASDGIEAMVKSIKELPFLGIIEVSLPKIYGFEVCKRLKLRPETKTMKFILVSSPYDKTRYKREPESFYEADNYIEEHRIPEQLMDSVLALSGRETEKKEEKIEEPCEGPSETYREEEPEPQTISVEEPLKPAADEAIERAKRLARTIVSDIYLYNTAKAEEAIRNDTFSTVFAAEMREGLKLYESRIPADVRAQKDFFKDVLTEFLEGKKKSS
jgi:predicted Zn finger-like uncharacterized protein